VPASSTQGIDSIYQSDIRPQLTPERRDKA
jgi:hypothetical protein